MNIEPPDLDVPLYRRDKMKILLPLAAGVVAWLWRPSDDIARSAISFFVGGAFLWSVLASSFSCGLSHHRIPIVRGLWLVVVIVGTVGFMRHVIPFLHALI